MFDNIAVEHNQKLDNIYNATLDLRSEQARHGECLGDLYSQVLEISQQLDLLRSPLRPQDSLSIHTDIERQMVERLSAQNRNLSEEQREELPALLNAIAKLEVSAGYFTEAKEHFESVADITAGTSS